MDRTRAGERVRLVHTDDPYTDLRPGDEGTIQWVDDNGDAHILWDPPVTSPARTEVPIETT